jgi:hypothetical protein
MRIPYISLVAAGALALGGCAYGDLGLGLGYGSPYYGYGYDSYYGGVPYGPYGGYGTYPGYYGGFGYGVPYGWYDNYYYPGSGYYVYDTYRRPHVMTSTQRAYWSSRSPALRTTTTTRTVVRPNWSGFDRRSTMRADRMQTREDRIQVRQERQQAREQRRQDRSNRPY